MSNRILTPLVLVVALMITINFQSFGQEEESAITLRNDWAEMIKSAETYNDYKIIKINKLQDFRSAMGDSLSSYTNSIASLESEKEKIQSELDYLKADLSRVNAELEESQTKIASISFLGIAMKKGTYSIILWSLIALLAVVVFVMYTRVKRVCSVVKRVKAGYSKVTDEFKAYRYQAKENQIKLKRELQTALNRLETID